MYRGAAIPPIRSVNVDAKVLLLLGGAAFATFLWVNWDNLPRPLGIPLHSQQDRRKHGRTAKTATSKLRLNLDWSELTHDEVLLQVLKTLSTVPESANGMQATAPCEASLELPQLVAQVQHLIAEVRNAKRSGAPLLVEGAPGIGKAFSLRAWVESEAIHRPAMYVRLSEDLNKSHGSWAQLEDPDTAEDIETDDDATLISEYPCPAFLLALQRAFGLHGKRYGKLSAVDATVEQDYSAAFSSIEQALRLIKQAQQSSPPLLVIDDVQLLFHDHLPLTEVYLGIREAFDWMAKCEQEGLLDLVFCSSDKSVLAALRSLRPYERTLQYRLLEPVADDLIVSYLLNDINPIIPEKPFTQDSADEFVNAFNGNLSELKRYISSPLPMDAYIQSRAQDYASQLRTYIPKHSEAVLRDVILSLIMRNGCLPVYHLERHQIAVLASLLEANFLRWRDGRMRRRESRETLKKYGFEDGEEGLSDEDERAIDRMVKVDPFALFAREGSELVWYNSVVRAVCESYFNEG
ncbi:hypothetical protein BC832DRAFT_108961 [Gaertneriomyces semiglobifer]|nr:hypothetical protein BC832DRAFT_108961 [Gaertneriomyces semiglobifer]